MQKMRLTDKMMLEEELKYDNSNTTYNEGFADGHRSGVEFAREFYENQKCETCKRSKDEKFPENHIWCNYLAHYLDKDFSCGKWEPRT